MTLVHLEVDISATPADGDVPAYDASSGTWLPTAAAGAYTNEDAQDSVGTILVSSATVRHALMNKSTFCAQPDIIVASTNPHNFPATTTAPTTAAGSNTASVLNNTAQMGGLYQMTGSMFGATVQSNYLVVAYQNPVVPTAAGAALNVRNLIITSISISPIVVGTVIVAGGQVVQWFVGLHGTAVSLATTDANGTTAAAQKAARLIPLPTVDTLAAAAAAGTVAPRAGESVHDFPTPLIVYPGEFLHIGVRSLQVTAAVTSGNYVAGIYVNGYWD